MQIIWILKIRFFNQSLAKFLLEETYLPSMTYLIHSRIRVSKDSTFSSWFSFEHSCLNLNLNGFYCCHLLLSYITRVFFSPAEAEKPSLILWGLWVRSWTDRWSSTITRKLLMSCYSRLARHALRTRTLYWMPSLQAFSFKEIDGIWGL